MADEVGAASAAFPAISTGIYHYPAQDAAEVAVSTVRATATHVERVVLCAYDDETADRYRALLSAA